MQCKNPIYLEKIGLAVPCSKCMSCRIRRQHEWCLRILHEYVTSGNKGVFITLTYDDDSIPENRSLDKTHLQNYYKKLRRDIDFKIKYFACGEYGGPPRLLENGKMSEGYRPHYHNIILGLDLVTQSELLFQNWDYCVWNDWRKMKCLGSVTPDSIRYTTDYLLKKFISNDEEKIKEVYGLRQPPFQLQSKGLGKDWAIKNEKEISETGKLNYKGNLVAVPRYYMGKVDIKDSVRSKNRFETIKKVCKEHGRSYIAETINPKLPGRCINPEYIDKSKQIDKNIKKKQEIFANTKIL